MEKTVLLADVVVDHFAVVANRTTGYLTLLWHQSAAVVDTNVVVQIVVNATLDVDGLVVPAIFVIAGVSVVVVDLVVYVVVVVVVVVVVDVVVVVVVVPFIAVIVIEAVVVVSQTRCNYRSLIRSIKQVKL